MRTLVACAATAVLSAFLFSGTANTTAQKASGTKTLRIGESLHVPGLDLWCSSWRRDPDRLEEGPILYCNRYSTRNSRAVTASRWRFTVSDKSGDYVIYRASRTP